MDFVFPPSPSSPKNQQLISITLDHLIGSPLALASQPYSKKAWMPFSSLPALQVPNLKIVQGSATAVNTERKIASIRTATGDLDEPYDYLIAASGLRRVFPVVPQSLTQDSYLVEAGAQIQAIGEAKEAIVVIGGGMAFLHFHSLRLYSASKDCN
jgi:NADH dehydrogenase FAD-containing subunit